VKAVNEVSTSGRETLRDTPSRVSISPNTTQGCRPISVKIQPKQLAARGRTGMTRPARNSQREVGVRPRRCAQSTHAAMAAAASPKPIMNRKLQ
jgi:hypothetical protein